MRDEIIGYLWAGALFPDWPPNRGVLQMYELIRGGDFTGTEVLDCCFNVSDIKVGGSW